MNQKTTKTDFDIIIIGAGPAGLSFACSLANQNLKTLIVERSPISTINNPKADGRETALTHNSLKILKKMGVWDLIDESKVSPLKQAKVFDGDSESLLNFDTKKSKIDALGYLVPNNLIRLALFKKASKLENLTIINDLSVDDINTNTSVSSITLSNGQIINSKLIVAADSRFSEIRRKMGIPSMMKDFSKVMIITRVSHEKPHDHTALECFNYGHTLALLPLNGDISSVVLTVPTDQADEMLEMDEEKFCKMASDGFGGKLGQMKQIGQRFSYPLVGVYAQKFISTRFALIGDAAVGMHPVTAHGFNLGLKGLDILSSEIKNALKNKIDIGVKEVLKNYQSKLHRAAVPVYLATNGIINLYTSNILPAKITRQFILRFVNIVKPVKQTFLNILK